MGIGFLHGEGAGMRLVMAGLDYTTAGVEVRDAFSPDAAARQALLHRMIGGEISGVVLLATCNRTEVYVSYQGDVPPDVAAMLCMGLGKEPAAQRKYFIERSERQAVEHLMRVAAGMCSGVPGDDQIVTQVRLAAEEAREAGTADSLLEALFRSAVTAGKKVRATVNLARDGASAARQAVLAAEKALGTLTEKRVLVIGNGTIGRLACGEFLARGCRVAITVRNNKKAPLPAGAEPVEFAERFRALAGCDLAVSATTSPHFTLTLADYEQTDNPPRVLADLAVPRDIDPAIGMRNGITLLNVDDLRPEAEDACDRDQRQDRADAVILEEAGRFDLWRRNRRRLVQVGRGTPDFPLFINLRGAKVLIAGGGRVAARRAEKLLAFGARVVVAAPGLGPEAQRLVESGEISCLRETYRAQHLDGATLAIAATDCREVNRQVGCDARERGIPVSVADARHECTFYFPAIVRSDCLTAGLISNNGDHGLVKRSAIRLRQEMEIIDANYQSGQSGEPVGDCPGGSGRERDTALSS